MSRHSLVTVDGMIYSLMGILQDKTKINSVFTLNPGTDLLPPSLSSLALSKPSLISSIRDL